MRRENLRSFFEASPTARLLRSDLAPLILDFLNRTFKSDESISLGLTELRTRLICYQEELHESEPNVLVGAADRYLTQWADAGWLHRYLESASTEPQFQLTRFAEEAIRFVDSALDRENALVGTESRMRLVIETLEDLVRGASSDPQRRLQYLKKQREVIDEEVAAIASGKSVQVYRPAQIRERFQTAIELLKALQSDFRAVEERFTEIARDVQKLQASGDSRGEILGFALDAEDLLKQQDEGMSFFAFVAFLYSPTQQEALRKTIMEVQQLAALAEENDAKLRLQRMVPSLLAEAEKVMRTTARLSATLRRLLDARAAAHRVRLATVLREIRQHALHLRNTSPRDFAELSVESELRIGSPLTRTFWHPPTTFQAVSPTEHVVDVTKTREIASLFASLQRLDLRKLRKVIREGTYEGNTETLGHLLTRQPPQGGVVEVLGYLQIAHDDGHRIDSQLTETVTIPEPRHRSVPLKVKIPHVTFIPKASSNEVGRKAR